MEIKKGFIEISEEECRLIVDERFLLINFPVKKAIKVYSYYEKLKNKEKESLTSEIQKTIVFSKESLSLFEEKEAFEKLLIVSYFLLKKHNIIMISDAGLSEESIMNFKIVIVEIIKQMKNKSLYFVRKKYTFVNIDLK
ncbi:hypothetical protein SAMN05421856_10648 [Chryseobacterium taichungense]|uniref:Uncharacterized protein n=1 Tax=Chryseobacterium taichungense TaxID=295069 RepID=A0A1H8ASA8_9FLAO|nr:hypothetical protein [Chryseobacterium taichungense]SEM73585.1 hypothetical protein SAMN05421856_10648 [Chryseobacterium taichungense]